MEGVTVVLIILIVVVALVLLLAVAALVRGRNAPDTYSDAATTTAESAGEATDAADEPVSPSVTGTWNEVHGVAEHDVDPAGPPAAILMAVTGTHPWSPARVFLGELKAAGYETTVELPDLVVVRDDDRRPVTVREPAGPPGHLVITAEPEQLPDTLEMLVRSLLADTFTLVATDGRDVHLADDDRSEIRLTVTELALA